VTRSRNDSMRS